MAEEMMNQQMGGGVMARPPENVSDVGDTQPIETQQPSQQQLLDKGREILMNRVEQLTPEEKNILANSITPQFTEVVTKIFCPAVKDFLEILTVESPNQESAPAPEPMVAEGEGMMMNRPPVEETAPAQV